MNKVACASFVSNSPTLRQVRRMWRYGMKYANEQMDHEKPNGDNMKNFCMTLMLAAIISPSVYANDFPTKDRVEYVLECMKNHAGKYEYLYKCSCAIDKIADKISYDKYVESSTAARDQGLGGPQGGVFRDPEDVKSLVKAYRAIQSDANKACYVQ